MRGATVRRKDDHAREKVIAPTLNDKSLFAMSSSHANVKPKMSIKTKEIAVGVGVLIIAIVVVLVVMSEKTPSSAGGSTSGGSTNGGSTSGGSTGSGSMPGSNGGGLPPINPPPVVPVAPVAPSIATGTATYMETTPAVDAVLLPGQYLVAPGGMFWIQQETNGNLTIWRGTPSTPSTPVWTSSITLSGAAQCFTELGNDGQLSSYEGSDPQHRGRLRWASAKDPASSAPGAIGKLTGGVTGAAAGLPGQGNPYVLQMGDNGSAMVRNGTNAAPGPIIWQSGAVRSTVTSTIFGF